MGADVRIVPRSEWGARHGRGTAVPHRMPWGEVVIHTIAGSIRDEDWPAITEAASILHPHERQQMAGIEHYHVTARGWQGIGYSFVIFEDGTICEGRGWGYSGGHTEGRNSTAAGVAFSGHGDHKRATEAQWGAAWWLIGEGIRTGHLTPRPLITGHRNYSTKGKTCPGNLIYPQLHRLHNITGNPRPTPTIPKPEEIDMATAAELRAEIKAANKAVRDDTWRLFSAINDRVTRLRDATLLIRAGDLAKADEKLAAIDTEFDDLRAELEALQS